MKAVAVPDATLQRTRARREALWSAAVRVEAAAARPASTVGWHTGLGKDLEALAAALATHVDGAESSDGLFGQVTQHAPRLMHAIDRLRGEHVGLHNKISTAIAHLGTVDPNETRTEIADLVCALVRHRQHGSDLVYEAFVVDLGAPD